MAQPNMTNNPNRPVTTTPVSRTWWWILAAIAVVVIIVIARGAMNHSRRTDYNTPAAGRRAPSDTYRPNTAPRDTLPPVNQEPNTAPSNPSSPSYPSNPTTPSNPSNPSTP